MIGIANMLNISAINAFLNYYILIEAFIAIQMTNNSQKYFRGQGGNYRV